ncbi:co-chaperone GroES family protein [Bradyrhizobium sp. Ai1a-2]|uniref:co-chaperone GroES family protein n=1 Tax=Bradyrhizobium sp. Ai1a-2 TaxID=196490 RepID=UPI00041C592E|nr:co-chaperone GroES family protein [Bradyrhizobium sp. Ai1a-2]
MIVTNAAERLSRAEDQKNEMLAAVGDLSKINLLHNRVLVGIYIEPEMTKGGIILSAGRVKESVWQGSVGLVLKKGNTAFKDEPESGTYFHGQDAQIGEWVVFRPGDARRVQINGVDCRMVEDSLLDMVVDDPNIITHR